MKENSNIKIAPSVLSADFLHLGDEILKCEQAGAAMIHIDVMDGIFVPNISIGVPIVSAIRRATELPLDVHLMIVNPIKYIKVFADAGADIITVHYEACDNLEETIDEIKKCGCLVGVSVKPYTDIRAIGSIMHKIDMVLIMSVEPGFGGQQYMDVATSKMKKLREYISKNNLNIDIQVDGGINKETIKVAASAGANVFVAGTAVFKAENPSLAIEQLTEIASNAIYNGDN